MATEAQIRVICDSICLCLSILRSRATAKDESAFVAMSQLCKTNPISETLK